MVTHAACAMTRTHAVLLHIWKLTRMFKRRAYIVCSCCAYPCLVAAQCVGSQSVALSTRAGCHASVENNLLIYTGENSWQLRKRRRCATSSSSGCGCSVRRQCSFIAERCDFSPRATEQALAAVSTSTARKAAPDAKAAACSNAAPDIEAASCNGAVV